MSRTICCAPKIMLLVHGISFISGMASTTLS
uniref:Uncharacterized protein n=1 Tax=Arundo donax TaxID=35708 RepID=A0A0A8ZMA2_ARUDO